MTALQQFLVFSKILPYRHVEVVLDALHSAGADFSIQSLSFINNSLSFKQSFPIDNLDFLIDKS